MGKQSLYKNRKSSKTRKGIKTTFGSREANPTTPPFRKGGRGGLIIDEEIAKVIPLLQERSKTLVEMAKGMEFYFINDIKYDEKAKEKLFTPSIKPVLEKLIEMIEKTEDFSHTSIEGIFNKLVEESKLKLGN